MSFSVFSVIHVRHHIYDDGIQQVLNIVNFLQKLILSKKLKTVVFLPILSEIFLLLAQENFESKRMENDAKINRQS